MIDVTEYYSWVVLIKIVFLIYNYSSFTLNKELSFTQAIRISVNVVITL